MRKLVLMVATLAALVVTPAVANAEITEVLDGDLQCGIVATEGNVSSSLGQRWCGSQPGSLTATLEDEAGDPLALPTVRSTHKTFDGVPLDVNVAFPAESGGDTDWPVVGMFHGYGGSKMNFNAMQRWLDRGYAVYSITNRGSGESCKNQGSIDADPTGCADGYVHLMDPRYEIRDTQNFLGELVDEGVISPTRIAATGGSYGGSQSMHLGVLKDRVMNLDGSLSPWKSPLGEDMEIAVATPNIPWTDLMQALAPNGDTLDYLEDGSFNGNVGIMKESYVQGLYVSARNAPAGTDPRADLATWKSTLDAGEPYDSANADAMKEEIVNYHSSYYVDHSQAPAPLLMSPGFTDDLFPVDEVIRYYNRTKAQYPNTKMAIFAGSFGHARGQSQSNVTGALRDLENAWVDYYLDDTGTEPASEVIAYTQTCPNGDPGAGPYVADDWASLAPGELRLVDDGGPQTIAANSGDPAVSALFNPLGPGVTACTTASDAKETGSATYDLPAAPAGGFTILGSANVVAKIEVGNSPNSQIAARLVDLDGAGNKTLISRGTWRPEGSGFQVFQVHPGAWEVEEGHVVRLELLAKDATAAAGGFLANYGRPSNGQQAITIDKVDLRIPVLEAPGALGGYITAPVKKVLPDREGAALAPGYEAIGSEGVVEYGQRVDPCPEGTTGTSPPDCTPDPCPAGTQGVSPDCTPIPPVVGNPSVVGAVKVKGKMATVKLTCKIGNDSCKKAKLIIKGAPKKGKKGKNLLVVKKSGLKVSKPGQTKSFKVKLTSKARKFFKDRKVRKRGKKKTVKGPKTLRSKVIVNNKSQGFKTVKRVGKVK